MSNINLKTCTKEDLRKSISTMLAKANTNTYILLEDEYTNNPSIIYTTDHKRKNNAFGQINVHMESIISYFGDAEGYQEDTTQFVDDLYNYIVKEYR